MQFLRSGANDAAPPTASPAKIVRCDQCQHPLGDKRVLTRDTLGVTRRFCPDGDCIAHWQRHYRTVFRRT